MDTDGWDAWIGREQITHDIVDAARVARLEATLSGLPGVSLGPGVAPRLIHFALCQPTVAMDGLGEDGHPARGDFLPPVPLPCRMWAGSAIAFHADLHIGEQVERRARISEISMKQGRSGRLCFVRVDHVVCVEGEVRITERQTLVYREAQVQGAPEPRAEAAQLSQTGTQVRVATSPALLFRYSALTFNSHRIHYDLPYATQAEGYQGLVVHGPLQASLLYRLASQMHGRAPDHFEFRGVAPLCEAGHVLLGAEPDTDGGVSLWSASPQGTRSMQARAQWI